MQNIRNLIGSTLIDVEVNVNGFTVLYFENQEGRKFAVDLCPIVKQLEETAPEVPVQEQPQEFVLQIDGEKIANCLANYGKA